LKGEETENQDPLQPGVSLVLVPRPKVGEGGGLSSRGRKRDRRPWVSAHYCGEEENGCLPLGGE